MNLSHFKIMNPYVKLTTQFIETGFKTLRTDARVFEHTQKLYNTVLDGSCSEEMGEIIDTINDTASLINYLQRKGISGNHVEHFQRALYTCYFILIRTIILQPSEERSEDDEEENEFQFLADFIQTRQFQDWIEENETRKANLAIYCLLVDGNRRNPSVQRALLEVDSYVKEILECVDDNGYPLKHKFTKMDQLAVAAFKLLSACLNTTEDEENRDETIAELTFGDMIFNLSNDLIESTFLYMKIRKIIWSPVYV